VLVFVIDTVNG
jgi:hypothetical protein